MATKQIGYADKQFLHENAEIPDINKVRDEDMNEIKEVVNNNANELTNLSLIKLWENPNPTATFNNQTITLSSEDYDYLIWNYGFYASNLWQQSTFCVKPANFNFQIVLEAARDYGIGGTGRYPMATYYRDIVIRNNKSCEITNCTIKHKETDTYVTDNNYIIPIAVYGGKF